MRLPFLNLFFLFFWIFINSLLAQQPIIKDEQANGLAELTQIKEEIHSDSMVLEEDTALIAAARESLLKNSPFGSNIPQEVPRIPTVPRVPARYELHGIMNLEGIWQFSLYDPKAKVSQWIASNDPTGPIKVINFNQQKNSVTILDNGQVQELVLKKSDTSSGNYTSSSGAGSFTSRDSSNSDFPTKEEFLELMLGKQNDKFKNLPGSRTRSDSLEDEDLDKTPSLKSREDTFYEDEDEDYEE
jgi:hypothetical protein